MVLLHLWLKVITFMVSVTFMVNITFMVFITFMGDTGPRGWVGGLIYFVFGGEGVINEGGGLFNL